MARNNFNTSSVSVTNRKHGEAYILSGRALKRKEAKEAAKAGKQRRKK
jgi:hypothetical protein